jgi:protein MpaA
MLTAAVASPPVLPTGRSVDGRPLRAIFRGDPAAPVRILVVGPVHGNEPAGIRIVRALAGMQLPAGVALVLVKDPNPDGHADHTRVNADGVDLNRNFPHGWRRSQVGSLQYGGPRPLSEPESRFLVRLIRATRPQISIWFHQPFGLVDLSGGSAALERRFARLAGLPARRLAPLPGTATRWENFTFPHTTSFVVEMPAGRIRAQTAHAVAEAVLELGASLR